MKAVLLCAGFGTRLQPLTKTIPKPLVKILNLSILEYNLNFLKYYEITDVFINRHHLPEEFLKIRIPEGLNLTYTLEKDILGTGGGILSFEKYLGMDDFLVMNGDILTCFDLKKLIEEHKKRQTLATLVLRKNDIKVTPVYVDDFNNIVAFGGEENNIYKTFMFTGIHILNPVVFKKMQHLKNKKSCIVRDYYIPQLQNKEKLSTFVLNEEKDLWQEVGTLNKYHQVNLELLKSLTSHSLDDIYSHYISDEWQNRKEGERIIEVVEKIWLGDDSSVDSNATIYSPVFIGRRTLLKKGCRIGPNVVLGDDVVIGENTELRDTVILDGVNIAEDLDIRNTLVATDFNYRVNSGE